MVRRRPPGTEEGWYVLHDLRRIDWDAWREAPNRTRANAIDEGIEFLQSHEALKDADEGGSAVFSIVGHKADILILHLRPTLEHLDRAERRFEGTALAEYTDQVSSYVSVTEVSGYMHEDLTDGLDDLEDEGMRNYMKQRIYPEIPDADHVCFYPMDKRRGPENNWYDLPFEERKEYMSAHGDIGRDYAGKVSQIITGSVGFDDYEWGVTLFADDPTEIKHLLYEMRFDPSSSRFAEFGPFYIGRRFPPEDLGALFDGRAVPTDEPLAGDTLDTAETESAGARSHPYLDDETTTDSDDGSAAEDDESESGSSGGRPDPGGASHEVLDAGVFRERAAEHGIDLADTDAGYGLLFESDAPTVALEDEVEELSGNFDHYDTHVGTALEGADGGSVVVSLWANERAANTASGFLADLPGVGSGIGAELTDEDAEIHGTDEDDSGGRPDTGGASHEEIGSEEFQRRVHRFGIHLDDHPDAGYALLFRSDTDAEDLVEEVEGLRGNFEHYDTHVLTTVRADSGDTAVVSLWANERAANTASGFLSDLSGTGPGVGAELTGDDAESHGTDEDDDVRGELADLDIYAGQPHGEDVYAMVLYSEADPEALHEELSELRGRFESYDSHVKSATYHDEHGGRSAVVSIWETKKAADKAGGFLSELPGIVGRAGEESGFGTMGMFYTVKPDHRETFVDTFDDVGEMLEEMDGHLETQLMVNTDDQLDMFIASQWRKKEDAMEFFRSDAFRGTVQAGREMLDDRPRHVFLA